MGSGFRPERTHDRPLAWVSDRPECLWVLRLQEGLVQAVSLLHDGAERLRALLGPAQEAEKLLEYPGFQQALTDVRKAALDTFQNSSPSQTAERDNAYWLLRALDGMEVALQNRVNEYELEKKIQNKQAIIHDRALRSQ